MKLVLVQSRGIVNDPVVNFFKARMRINNIDADIFVFPEMFCCGYTGNESEMKIDVLPEKVLDKLSNLSKIRGSAIICGCPVKEDGKIYDGAMLISGDERSVYKKMKLSSDGAFDETKVFAAGDRPAIVDHMGLRIGLSVGDDLLMHNLYRFYSDSGVDLLVCISAYTDEQMDKFEKIVQCRAAENELPVVLCNMVGNDCGVKMAGRSKYIGPDGKIIENCTDSSDVREISIDETKLKEIRAKRKPVTEKKLGKCMMFSSVSYEGDDPDNYCPLTDMKLI